MNTKKKTIKSILCCATACSALAIGGIGATEFNNNKYQIYATGVSNIPVSISNASFNNDNKSGYPYNPSSYTAYNQGLKVDKTNFDPNITAGVISLTNEKYQTRFASAKRHNLDQHVLMIDSTKEENGKTTMHNANYGFQTASSLKLDANSKYMFTVDVFTLTNAKIASLYLFDSNGEIFSSISGINSYNSWQTYSFFVSTNNISGAELKLGMYLEGAGTVLFDNISGYKLTDSEYSLSKNTATAGTFTETDKVNNIIKIYNVNNNGELVNTTDSTDSSSLIAYTELGDHSEKTVEQDSDGQNKNAILITNDEKSYVQYETAKNFLTFEQNTIYKVSVNVKTKDLEGSANLQLVRTDLEEDDENYSTDYDKIIKITSNTYSESDSITNDYETYSFLINSHPTQSVSYKFVFGLGQDAENMAKGEMYVSEIEISKVDYATYNSASTGSDTEKIDFVTNYAYKDSKIRLNNGDFNAFKIADYTKPMPATPVDWEVSIGKNTQKYGVVNTKTFDADLAHLSLSNLTNPSIDKNQNVLMMYNETADRLSYTSATKSLTRKTYHKFEISVQTQNAPLKISLVTKKDSTEVELLSKIVDTNYNWQDVTMYIYTGNQDMDVSLKLTLDTTSFGYAYVDDAKFDYLLTASQLEEEFNNAESSTYVQKIDLSNILTSSSTDNFSNTTLISTNDVSGVTSGLVTLNSSHLDEVIFDEANLETFNSLTNKSVFGIRATDDIHYTATSNVGFKLLSGENYYKISVAVYTQNLSSNNSSANADLLGAGVKLTGFEDSFTTIQSNNTWTTYTFYIQPESDITTYLEFSLGNADALAKGDVFFGDIQFVDDITAEEYNRITSSETIKVLKVQNTDSSTEDEKTSDDKKDSISNTTWIYLIPSLLTALAILIAVVGFAVRKIKIKKPVKKSKTSYDRNKTVSIQYYTRKATTLREEKIRELTADYEKLNSERKKFEEEYKQDLTKLREMKIKRAPAGDIAKLEKDLKKNQKMSASLGATLNKLSDELSYAKTDAYLNSLIKKLSRESSQTKETSNE